MGWFEQNPIVLVAVIIATFEGWSYVRRHVVAFIEQRKAIGRDRPS